MPKTETTGRELRRLRENLALTMHDVYAASKVADEAQPEVPALYPVGWIERGETGPNIYRLSRLAFAYDVPMRKMLALYGACGGVERRLGAGHVFWCQLAVEGCMSATPPPDELALGLAPG